MVVVVVRTGGLVWKATARRQNPLTASTVRYSLFLPCFRLGPFRAKSASRAARQNETHPLPSVLSISPSLSRGKQQGQQRRKFHFNIIRTSWRRWKCTLTRRRATPVRKKRRCRLSSVENTWLNSRDDCQKNERYTVEKASLSSRRTF